MASTPRRIVGFSTIWIALSMTSQAIAGGHHRQTQVLVPVQGQPVYAAQAPVTYAQAPVNYTAQAPVTYAQSPVNYTAQAPVTYAQAPVTYAAQAPVTYAQSPVSYTGQAPATAYAPANVTYVSSTVGAAPTGSAPGEDQVRLSQPIRRALLAELIADYHGTENGDTQVEKITYIQEEARARYIDLLGDESDGELNLGEQDDVRALVDEVLTAPTRRRYESSATAQRNGYPANSPYPGYYPVAVPVPVATYAPAPVTLVPVYRVQPAPSHPHSHHLFHHKQ